jgi:ATP-dependent DNA ligase
VLAVDGHATAMNNYGERRALLEELGLEHGPVRLVATFEDGEALFDAVCARRLEGVVATRLADPYLPASGSR